MKSHLLLKGMITLIEGEYHPNKRNTPIKMKSLIAKEFEYQASEQEIMRLYGLIENYERESNKIENGYY